MHTYQQYKVELELKGSVLFALVSGFKSFLSNFSEGNFGHVENVEFYLSKPFNRRA